MDKRPKLHFTPPKNWMNDPNGLCFYKGEYHLFYQHNPENCYWGNMTWGHAKSKDLFSWEHLDYALIPDKGFADEDGCFSGSAFIENDELYLAYTGIVMTEKKINEHGNPVTATDDSMISTQLFAKSKDGIHFEKLETEIVAPQNSCKAHFRDPKVWKKDEIYYMVVGAKELGKGKILLYKSEDLKDWEVLSKIKKDDFGFMWECPDMFSLDGKDVLIFSPQGIGENGQEHISGYFVGELDYGTGSYNFDKFNLLDYGFEYYAPQTFLDGKGRRILIGWLVNHAPLPGENWSGMMTLPRELKVIGERLYSYPVEEILSYRKELVQVGSVTEKSIEILDGTFDMEFKVNLDKDFNLTIFKNKVEGLELSWDEKTSVLNLDRSGVINGFKPLETFGVKRELEISNRGVVDFRVIGDKSVVEIYVNGGEFVMSSVINRDKTQNNIFFKGEFEDIKLWKI